MALGSTKGMTCTRFRKVRVCRGRGGGRKCHRAKRCKSYKRCYKRTYVHGRGWKCARTV